MAHPGIEPPDLSEKGRDEAGSSVSLDRRLFVSLTVLEGEGTESELQRAVEAAGLQAVVYLDVVNPRRYGLLTWHEDPAHFTGAVRAAVQSSGAKIVDDACMLGRTYTQGYESDPMYYLVEKVPRTVLAPSAKWVVWYPLRRTGAFARLKPDEQRKILMEHGMIGRSFAAGGYANDVRLASYGLDRNDNDFVIGLLGEELYPLSAVVQRMRSTVQTSEYISSLGPFFVGKTVWQAAMEED